VNKEKPGEEEMATKNGAGSGSEDDSVSLLDYVRDPDRERLNRLVRARVARPNHCFIYENTNNENEFFVEGLMVIDGVNPDDGGAVEVLRHLDPEWSLCFGRGFSKTFQTPQAFVLRVHLKRTLLFEVVQVSDEDGTVPEEASIHVILEAMNDLLAALSRFKAHAGGMVR
jgi:hypothetical protein